MLRKDILQDLHKGAVGGHLGEEKTQERLKDTFYCQGHWGDVRDWCRTCAACAQIKTPMPKQQAPLQVVKVGYLMQVMAMDLFGPLLESCAGNSYVFVIADYFTHWVEAFVLPNQETKTVAKKLVDEVFCKFSKRNQLHSNQGKQFESGVIQEICTLLQI